MVNPFRELTKALLPGAISTVILTALTPAFPLLAVIGAALTYVGLRSLYNEYHRVEKENGYLIGFTYLIFGLIVEVAPIEALAWLFLSSAVLGVIINGIVFSLDTLYHFFVSAK